MRKSNKAKIAAKYRCSVRTIDRWEREKAPLGDEEKMVVWLAGRKNIPPRVAAWLAERQKTARAEIHSIQELPTGAKEALRRLEGLEATSYTALLRAMRGGDAAEIKVAREGWLKIGDSLRRYDLQLATSGRGDSVSRKEVEAGLAAFGHGLHFAMQHLCASLARLFPGTPDQLDHALRNVATHAVVVSAARYEKFPDWIGEAVAKNSLTGLMRFEPGHLERLSEFIREYIDSRVTMEMLRELDGEALRQCINDAQTRIAVGKTAWEQQSEASRARILTK